MPSSALCTSTVRSGSVPLSPPTTGTVEVPRAPFETISPVSQCWPPRHAAPVPDRRVPAPPTQQGGTGTRSLGSRVRTATSCPHLSNGRGRQTSRLQGQVFEHLGDEGRDGRPFRPCEGHVVEQRVALERLDHR